MDVSATASGRYVWRQTLGVQKPCVRVRIPLCWSWPDDAPAAARHARKRGLRPQPRIGHAARQLLSCIAVRV
eukprot:4130333-Pyramimonas_sp.AAC.1